MGLNYLALFRKNAAKTTDTVKIKSKATAASGSLSRERQFRFLGAAFALFFLLAAAVFYIQLRNSAQSAAYSGAINELKPLAYQISPLMQNALQGNEASFEDMANARVKINQTLAALKGGGVVNGVRIRPTSGESRQHLDKLSAAWAPYDAMLIQVADRKQPLEVLGKLALESIAQSKIVRQAAESSEGKLAILAERILRAAIQLGWATGLNEDDAEELSRQLTRDIPAALALAPSGSELQTALSIIDERFADLPVDVRQFNQLFSSDADTQASQEARQGIAPDVRPIVKIRTEGAILAKNSQGLIAAADALAARYQDEFATHKILAVAAPVFGVLAFAVLVALILLYNHDTNQRRESAEEQRRQAEASTEKTQNAILRLLNELGDLADGDLTIRTTVTEDITGSIADSVNFAIEELATLVRRANSAAERVTKTTEQAQHVTTQLLQASETQANEIRSATASVLTVANSMDEVSATAQKSAEVARASLSAAQKGADAMADSITGMNEIRNQIQDTAKRIKRLGESSQEIGEIVELISDITEQTNVLALNAAIQAASAGEAGRGFSVVAEEVQRLAERSAAATKQIATLVKTIQTDTHDAVAAMERSTQDVVEGAKLSDAAGQSLADISDVSKDLTQRVENIASATQAQARSAIAVTELMQHILEITSQTTSRTQKTALAVSELAQLAIELKGSVAGFKV